MAKNVFSSIVNKSGNISKMSNDVLHNRFILYFIFILAVGNLFHFVFSNDLMSVGVFIVSGLLTSFFSKNMVVIMVISMVVTNVIRVGGGTEGFESKGGIMENMQDALNAIEELEDMEGEGESDEEEEDEEEEDEEVDEEVDEEKTEEEMANIEGFHNRVDLSRQSMVAINKAITKALDKKFKAAEKK